MRGYSATGTQGNFGNRLRAAALAGTAVAALLVAGCTVVPEPISQGDRLVQAATDRGRLFSLVEPISGPISLEEAIARSLKYNLDQRLALMDQVLQQRQLDLSTYDMLPRLAASAGYTTRNNEAFSISRDVQGNPSSVADATTSQERTRFTADLGLSWNVLDFGLSYYQAKQQADRRLIAEERRRRVIHAIVQQVRAAYWQAVSAQRLETAVVPIVAEARRALDSARQVEQQRLRPLLDVLRYQKALVEIVRQLETIQQDLAIAKAQLGALMNLPPGEPFMLAPPATAADLPRVALGLEQMENMALLNRPELREEAYQKRITSLEARKALLRMLPGLNLNAGLNYDSNDFLVNNTWADAGARVTWNLLNLVSAPATMRLQEAQEQLADTRRLALSMAALTQVHVGYQQYLRAVDMYEKASLLHDIEQRIYENVRAAAQDDAERELERIRAGASAIAVELARDRAYADVQNAVSALYVSLGLDPLPAEVASHDLPTLAAAVKSVSDDWMAGRLPLPPEVPVVVDPAAEPVAEVSAPPAEAAPAAEVTPAGTAPVAEAAPAGTPAQGVRTSGSLDFLRDFVASAMPDAT
ncbi:TolC family protein [Arenibaculum sp.]|uniref:TolC family protein n=1 Tax=Arenibaculum sp. TaxID=2865862 RepID=UPI002E132E82|nr:TolC family protein [Arenibaculum sp.]